MSIVALARNLEHEALQLFRALDQHPTPYARTRLAERAFERWERRCHFTDQVQRLQRKAGRVAPASWVLAPCPGCNADGLVEAEAA